MANKPMDVGGQAVMEGVMMKGADTIAIAVRKTDGEIVLRTHSAPKLSAKYKFLRWPVVRGVVNFVNMLMMGVRTLSESANMAGLEQEEPSAFEKRVAKLIGKKAEDVMMMLAVVLAVGLAVGLFFVLPSLVEQGVKRLMLPDGVMNTNAWQKALLNILGGVVRIGIFVTYVALVSRVKEIKRVFMYHGAEHKAVYCFESGQPLTVENAQRFSTLHPRCGTSFLVIVMIISVVVFMFLGTNNGGALARVGSRLLLLPLVAGISYEVLKALAHAQDNAVIRALKWPGLMLQKLTTAQPEDGMVQVALVALKAALDMPAPMEGVERPGEAIADAEGAQDEDGQDEDGRGEDGQDEGRQGKSDAAIASIESDARPSAAQ